MLHKHKIFLLHGNATVPWKKMSGVEMSASHCWENSRQGQRGLKRERVVEVAVTTDTFSLNAWESTKLQRSIF